MKIIEIARLEISEGTKKNLPSTAFKKGQIPHNKGKQEKGHWKKCKLCGKKFWCYACEEENKRFRNGKMWTYTRRYCSYECAFKDKKSWRLMGDKHQNWKGGRTMTGGYIYMLSPSHPNRNINDRVAEHRLVMEKFLGRYLIKNEEVHHKNGVKDDNRIKNLELVVKKLHFGVIKCPYCQNNFKIK